MLITLPTSRCTPPMVDRLKDVLTAHPGKAEVRVKLIEGKKATLLRLRAPGRRDAGADGRSEGAARPGCDQLQPVIGRISRIMVITR